MYGSLVAKNSSGTEIKPRKTPTATCHFFDHWRVDEFSRRATLPVLFIFNAQSMPREFGGPSPDEMEMNTSKKQPESINLGNFPGDGTTLEERMSRDRQYPNYERQLETIKPIIEQIQSLYDATDNMESSYRNGFRHLLSAMEVALRHEASFLENPDQYAKWREADPTRYPERGELDPVARKYLDQAIANINFGTAKQA